VELIVALNSRSEAIAGVPGENCQPVLIRPRVIVMKPRFGEDNLKKTTQFACIRDPSLTSFLRF
jgi:hypothetical protein